MNKRNAILLVLLLFTFTRTFANNDKLPRFYYKWMELSESNRNLHEKMTLDANLRGNWQYALNSYLSNFAKDVTIYGLTDSPVSKAGMLKHYTAVFRDWKLMLTHDVQVIAGNRGAERYHAYGDNFSFGNKQRVLEGKLHSGPFLIKGQDIYIFKDGKINTRWSNHFHSFREGLLFGEKGRRKAIPLEQRLNGYNFTEKEINQHISSFFDILSMNYDPVKRKQLLNDLFSEKMKSHGFGNFQGNKKDVFNYFDFLWKAFPNLIYQINQYANAWNQVGIAYSAIGTHLHDFYGYKPSEKYKKPIKLTGEMVITFDLEGKIVDICIYDHLIPLLKQLK